MVTGWDIFYHRMIEHITVRDFAILDEVDLDLRNGLTALTGETGSGKSVLIQALGVCLGSKPSKVMVRSTADRAMVEATINGQMYRRILPKRGRVRSFIDDEPVPDTHYRASTMTLADFHGQHEQQLIMDARTHIDYLDRYAGLSAKVNALTDLYDQIQTVRKDLEDLQKQQQRATELRELYTFQLQELDAVDPQEGEDETLSRELAVLSHAQELITTIQESNYQLVEAESSLTGELTSIIKQLERLTRYDEGLTPFIESLNSALVILQETTGDLSQYGDSLDHDPARLQTVEERLQALESLKRKYGGSLAAVLETRQQISTDLQSIHGLGDQIKDRKAELRGLETRFVEQALELHQRREKVAWDLAQDLEAALQKLAMPYVKVEVRVWTTPDATSFCQVDGKGVAVSEKGIDRVEFYLSANPGEALKPLADIASGGEISRIMLGLKTVFQKTDPVETMIFDEIDTGISGATANKVARALKDLSRSKQVICITHLPQIVSVADHHLHVKKTVNDDMTRVSFDYLGHQDGQLVIQELTAPIETRK